MLNYISKRLAIMIAILIVISIGSFAMVHLLPGDIATVILGTADTPANRRNLYKQLGLDRNVVVQYWIWMKHVLVGNLGQSYISHEKVTTIILKALPVDLEIIFLSQILALGCAIPLAMKAARRPNGLFDRISNTISFGLLSVPSFIIVVYAVLVIAILIKIPNTGPASFVRFPSWSELFSSPGDFFSTLRLNLLSMTIPAIAGAIASFVIYFRTLRSDMVSTLQEEFITMARSKGLRTRRIMWKHAFRPSSVALLSTIGINVGGALAGGFVVQYLLAIPGLGTTLIAAITTKNYLLIQGIVLVVAVAVIVLNFAIDFLTTIIDPRISRD